MRFEINVYSVPQEKTSPKFAAAFAQGCGGTVREEYVPGIWAGFVSPKNWNDLHRHEQNGFDFYYGDHGYFGRGKYYRVTKNAVQHSGIGKSIGRRIQEFWTSPLPWQKTGKNIILCPQSDHFFSRFGLTRKGWIDDVNARLDKVTDRPVVIHDKREIKPLRSLFADAWAVIGFSSMSGLDALMHGIPAVNTQESAIISLTTELEKIETPFYPDNRMEVASVLADNQWTLDEMRDGTCWRELNGLG